MNYGLWSTEMCGSLDNTVLSHYIRYITQKYSYDVWGQRGPWFRTGWPGHSLPDYTFLGCYKIYLHTEKSLGACACWFGRSLPTYRVFRYHKIYQHAEKSLGACAGWFWPSLPIFDIKALSMRTSHTSKETWFHFHLMAAETDLSLI